MLRPIFAVLPLDIRSLGYRACCRVWQLGLLAVCSAFGGRFSFEILTRRVVMDLLRSPSRVLIEIGDFDSHPAGSNPGKRVF